MEQILAYLIGLQIGMAITALYFVVRIAMMKLTPSYIYWIFALGITGAIREQELIPFITGEQEEQTH